MKLNIRVLALFICLTVVSCQNKSASNVVPPNRGLYSQDSLKLVNYIRGEIKEKNGGFFASKYSRETEIIIDTIIYSPGYDKFFAFIINNAKIDTRESLEGKTYLGMRVTDSLNFVFYGYNLNGFEPGDYKGIREFQERYFFKDFTKNEEEGYEYNFNDERFWTNEKFWDKILLQIRNKQEFDSIKLVNPENVFEPQR